MFPDAPVMLQLVPVRSLSPAASAVTISGSDTLIPVVIAVDVSPVILIPVVRTWVVSVWLIAMAESREADPSPTSIYNPRPVPEVAVLSVTTSCTRSAEFVSAIVADRDKRSLDKDELDSVTFSLPAREKSTSVDRVTREPVSVIDASPMVLAPVNLARVFVVPPGVVTPPPKPTQLPVVYKQTWQEAPTPAGRERVVVVDAPIFDRSSCSLLVLSRLSWM